MTLAEIGEAIGLATSTVSDLANGHSKAPGGDAAVALHELHRRKCFQARRAPDAAVSGTV